MYKMIAFDLDGTLTQHKTQLEDDNKQVLDELSEKYKLLMVGAGDCLRIFKQLNNYPIDIIGNYGMQVAFYQKNTLSLRIAIDEKADCDRESVEKRVTILREKFGLTDFVGDNVQFHSSGCVTFPVLGTKAELTDKLSFDPKREKRRKMYIDVCQTFPEYNVFVGGSSSFDMSPKPFNKYYALKKYCEEQGIATAEVLFVGDDYGLGGNDECVYKSDIDFLTIDDYKDLPKICTKLL